MTESARGSELTFDPWNVSSLLARLPAVLEDVRTLASRLNACKMQAKLLQDRYVAITDHLNGMEPSQEQYGVYMQNIWLQIQTYESNLSTWSQYDRLHAWLHQYEISESIHHLSSQLTRHLEGVAADLLPQPPFELMQRAEDVIWNAKTADDVDARKAVIEIVEDGKSNLKMLYGEDRDALLRFLDAVQTEMWKYPTTSQKHKLYDERIQQIYLNTSVFPPVYQFQLKSLGHPILKSRFLDTHKINKLSVGGTFAVRVIRGIPRNVPDAEQRLNRQVQQWSRLRHPNIHRVLGLCQVTGNPTLKTVSVWIKSDILSHLAANPKTDTGSLLLGAARGLEYLHSKDVVHGDLRAENILIKPSGDACLTNFDITPLISRLYSGEGAPTVVTNPLSKLGSSTRFTAPEVLFPEVIGRDTPTFSEESDCHSFGMVIVEVFTGVLPFLEISRDDDVMELLVRGDRPPRPRGQAQTKGLDDTMWGIAEACWAFPPNRRISAPTIVQRLRNHNHMQLQQVSALPLPVATVPDPIVRRSILSAPPRYESRPDGILQTPPRRSPSISSLTTSEDQTSVDIPEDRSEGSEASDRTARPTRAPRMSLASSQTPSLPTQHPSTVSLALTYTHESKSVHTRTSMARTSVPGLGEGTFGGADLSLRERDSFRSVDPSLRNRGEGTFGGASQGLRGRDSFRSTDRSLRDRGDAESFRSIGDYGERLSSIMDDIPQADVEEEFKTDPDGTTSIRDSRRRTRLTESRSGGLTSLKDSRRQTLLTDSHSFEIGGEPSLRYSYGGQSGQDGEQSLRSRDRNSKEYDPSIRTTTLSDLSYEPEPQNHMPYIRPLSPEISTEHVDPVASYPRLPTVEEAESYIERGEEREEYQSQSIGPSFNSPIAPPGPLPNYPPPSPPHRYTPPSPPKQHPSPPNQHVSPSPPTPMNHHLASPAMTSPAQSIRNGSFIRSPIGSILLGRRPAVSPSHDIRYTAPWLRGRSEVDPNDPEPDPGPYFELDPKVERALSIASHRYSHDIRPSLHVLVDFAEPGLPPAVDKSLPSLPATSNAGSRPVSKVISRPVSRYLDPVAAEQDGAWSRSGTPDPHVEYQCEVCHKVFVNNDTLVRHAFLQGGKCLGQDSVHTERVTLSDDASFKTQLL